MPKAPRGNGQLKSHANKRRNLKESLLAATSGTSLTTPSRSVERKKKLDQELQEARMKGNQMEENRITGAIQAVNFAKGEGEARRELAAAAAAPFMPSRNNEFGVLSPAEQQQALELIEAIPSHSDSFEMFSKLPLEDQLGLFQSSHLSGGGQKGGGEILTETQHVIKGVFKLYIKPAWENLAERGKAAASNANNIVVNYLTRLTDILSNAGVGNVVSEQHLANLLYGLTVLATAYQTGVLAMFPGLMAEFINILNQCIRLFPTLLPSAATMGLAAGATAVYRYREIPMGIYGVFAAVSTPFFSAAWAVGDAKFRAANPNLGENMQAGLKFQMQEWENTMNHYRNAGRATLDNFIERVKPARDFTKALITGWNQYVKTSIRQAIRGGRLFTADVNAVIDYINFLHDIGAGIRPTNAEMAEAQAEAMAQIADLLGPEVDPQLVAGAVAMGVGLIEMEQDGEPVTEEQVNDVTEAAAALLALTTDNQPPIPVELADNAVHNLLSVADLAPMGNGAINMANNAAAAAASGTNYSTTFTGGKPRRRRHRKTAKKSHKKKHTKKHKRKTTNTKKGKKGKKSKKHTKRRSHKGGNHGPHD